MKLLVVEDHGDLRHSLEKGLRAEGYAVDSAADGAEAEYLIKNWEYDGAILDLMLPEKSGWELLELIRSKGNCPVLILTANDTVTDRVRGLDSGADDYLVKPFAYDELKARLRAMIRRSTGHASPNFVCGDIEMHCARRIVTLSGEELTLTQREYAVLEILIQRQDEVVSRADLFESLGDMNEDSFSNVMDVMICKLRRKLGKERIQTRRGHGYCLKAV